MSDPKLAEALSPRLAANRRMATESQAIPALPDRTASAPVGRFGKNGPLKGVRSKMLNSPAS